MIRNRAFAFVARARRTVSLIFGSSMVLLFAAPVSAETLYVPSQFPTIQSAVDGAVNGDEIVIASGVYSSGFDFHGKRLLVHSADGALSTIIDLSAVGGTACRAETAEPVGTIVRGLTIKGATTSAIVVGPFAMLAVEDCRVIDSTTYRADGGAGVRCAGGSVNVSGTIFSNLESALSSYTLVASGGAIKIQADGDAAFDDCVFSNCRVTNSVPSAGTGEFTIAAARGGAIACSQSSVRLTGCTIDACSAFAHRPFVYPYGIGYGITESRGGALVAESSSTLTVSTSTISNCVARASFERLGEGNGQAGCDWQSQAENFMARAFGGAIASHLGSSVSISAVELVANHAVGRVGTHGSSLSYMDVRQVSIYAIGGSIHFDGYGTGATLDCEFLSSSGSQCRRETYAANPAGATHIDDCINFTAKAREAAFFPGVGGGTISDSSFHHSTGTAVEIFGGTGVGLINCTFNSNIGNSLLLNGNAPLVSGCTFQSSSGAPIYNSGSGSGPTVIGSEFCANTPNTITGAWIDGGGNSFDAVCMTSDCNNNGIEDAVDIKSGTAQDCNSNGLPDGCDIASELSMDCDENEIPDDCEFPALSRTSPSLSPVQSGTTLTHSFQGLPQPGTDVLLTVDANADLSSVNETIQVKSGTTVLGTLFQTGGADCAAVSASLLIPRAQFESLIGVNGTLSLQFIPSFAVTPGTCATSSLICSVQYQPEVAGDCNANATPDVCDVLFGKSADVNENLIPDECEALPPCLGDFNLDGQVNSADLAILLNAWGTANADLDRDGTTNAADLATLLGLFSPCS